MKTGLAKASSSAFLVAMVCLDCVSCSPITPPGVMTGPASVHRQKVGHGSAATGGGVGVTFGAPGFGTVQHFEFFVHRDAALRFSMVEGFGWCEDQLVYLLHSRIGARYFPFKIEVVSFGGGVGVGMLSQKPSAVFSGDLEIVLGRRFRWFELSFPLQVGLSFLSPRPMPVDFAGSKCPDNIASCCPDERYRIGRAVFVNFHLNAIFHVSKRIALTAFGGMSHVMELGRKRIEYFDEVEYDSLYSFFVIWGANLIIKW